MNIPCTRFAFLIAAAWLAMPADAQVIANSSFEGDSLAGWTIGGTERVGTLQAGHISGGLPGGVPDGSWFVALSTTPEQTGTGVTARIDANTTLEYDIATLSTTVSIPFWPAALEFDWTFPSSEQDQVNEYDDLFDVMVYAGAPPTDPTVNNRLFARSAPRNTPQDYSNFTNAHFLGTALVNRTINRPGSQVHGTALRYGVAGFRRECIGIDLPEFPGPPYTRTIRFRVADQGDRNFDSALLLDRVQVVQRCDAAQQMTISQRTNTSGSELRLKDGGLQYRPVQARKHAIDAAGRVQAVASNANLDGNNPNLVEQVYLQLDQGGWQRASGLVLNDGGEVQALALSGTVGTTAGRYLAIAARTSATDNIEIFRWDRQLGSLSTLTSTSGCDNTNPSINHGGTVIAFESTCHALTASGTAKKIVLWTGSTTPNTVTNFQGGGSCIGRSPALNTRSGAQDGAYVAFESNCNHVGANGDLNFEIFRYRNSADNRFAQITNTSGAAVINTLPQMDRSDHTGSNTGSVYFLSNLADTSRGLQVFRHTCANANCTSGTRTQWTDGPATQWYTGFRKLIRTADNNVILDFVFERMNLGTGFVEVGHRIGPTGQETTITLDQPLLDLGGGMDGSVPVIGFIHARDVVAGQNTDLNPELFHARVQ